jgi:hypothetical protein
LWISLSGGRWRNVAFKAKHRVTNDPGPQVRDLTSQEEARLQTSREGLTKLATGLGLPLPQDDEERLALCDELIRWWHREPQGQRIDPNVVVTVVGIAMGDVLAREFGLVWKIITDAFGTDLGLWRAKGHIVLSPTNSIAKHFADESDGFVVNHYAAFRAQLRKIDGW